MLTEGLLFMICLSLGLILRGADHPQIPMKSMEVEDNLQLTGLML